jgi:hypothetical protein
MPRRDRGSDGETSPEFGDRESPDLRKSCNPGRPDGAAVARFVAACCRIAAAVQGFLEQGRDVRCPATGQRVLTSAHAGLQAHSCVAATTRAGNRSPSAGSRLFSSRARNATLAVDQRGRRRGEQQCRRLWNVDQTRIRSDPGPCDQVRQPDRIPISPAARGGPVPPSLKSQPSNLTRLCRTNAGRRIGTPV